nr:hypothetical protein HK105_006713 [Polyrhizophydium stewartii]
MARIDDSGADTWHTRTHARTHTRTCAPQGTQGSSLPGKPLGADDFCSVFVMDPMVTNAPMVIKDTITSMCLAVVNNTVNVENTPVVLNTCTGSVYQTWTYDNVGRIKAATSNNCVAFDAAGSLVLRSCSYQGSGCASFVTFKDPKLPPSLKIQHKKFTWKCAGGYSASRKVVKIHPVCSIFQFDSLSRMRDVQTGLCLDVFNGNFTATGNNSILGVYSCHTGINQKWTLSTDGKKIKAGPSNNCVDVDWVRNKLVLNPCDTAQFEFNRTSVRGSRSQHRFAPYSDVNMFNVDLGNIVKTSGLKNVIFGFVVRANGQVTWGGQYPIISGTTSAAAVDAKIASVRSNGGEVIASFGGAVGQELAVANLTATQLQAAYQTVIDFYGVTTIDFDIEGSTLNNAAANSKRHTAVAGLVAANVDLEVYYTVPVDVSGLQQNAISFIQSGIDQGVAPSFINIMAMDYGQSQDDMGFAAISAAHASYSQLDALGLNLPIGVTVMIGRNDISGTFTLANADALIGFAEQTSYIRLLSFWSLNRDNGNNSGLDTSSMIDQSPFAFTNKFVAFDD